MMQSIKPRPCRSPTRALRISLQPRVRISSKHFGWTSTPPLLKFSTNTNSAGIVFKCFSFSCRSGKLSESNLQPSQANPPSIQTAPTRFAKRIPLLSTKQEVPDTCQLIPLCLFPETSHEPLWFHAGALRDHCKCEACIDSTSNQKMFDTASIPLDISPKFIKFERKDQNPGTSRSQKKTSSPSKVLSRLNLENPYISSIHESHLDANQTYMPSPSLETMRIGWNSDIEGFPPEHETFIDLNDLKSEITPLFEKRSHDFVTTASIGTESDTTQRYENYFSSYNRAVHETENQLQTNKSNFQKHPLPPAMVPGAIDISPPSQIWVDNKCPEPIPFPSLFEASTKSLSTTASASSGLRTLAENLHRHGIAFVGQIPDSPDQIIRLATRLGPLRNSLYGLTWDVRPTPQALNVAYTSQNLGLHMDLLYMSEPPRIQILHSLRARAPGGESLFADSFRAAVAIRESDPAAFASLVTFPITFQYLSKLGHHYRQVKRTIELLDSQLVIHRDCAQSSSSSMPHSTSIASSPLNSPITCVNWSPPFQAPLHPGADPAATHSFLRAIKVFAKELERKEMLINTRLEEGQAVLFDNRRIVHARRAFDASKGERWLRGAYVDGDSFWSLMRVLRAT